MENHKQKVHAFAKSVIQKMISLEKMEWPPSTPFAFYQPRRPFSEHVHNIKSVK